MGLEDEARQCFSAGVVAHRNDATLLQAWGLFESKNGALTRAVRLLHRAVILDPSLEKVLSWSRFRDQSTDLRHLRASRMRLQPAMVAGKATSPSVLSSTDEDDDSAFKLAIAVPQPGVKYTIPQSLLGWKGRAEEGEDPDAWYDARGRRKGPPLNYWRQSMDERIHGQCMDAIQEIIDEADDHDGTPRPMLDALLRGLEGRMSIVKPMCNRKLLGRWAPIVLDGIVVARTAPEADSRVGARGGYVVSAPIVEIARSHGRKIVEHRYGQMDAHLEDGESLTIRATTALGASDVEAAVLRANSTACFRASAVSNERRLLTLEASERLPGVASVQSGDVGEVCLYIGGVTLLSDYLLVAREAGGALREVYMRVDEQVGA